MVIIGMVSIYIIYIEREERDIGEEKESHVVFMLSTEPNGAI